MKHCDFKKLSSMPKALTAHWRQTLMDQLKPSASKQLVDTGISLAGIAQAYLLEAQKGRRQGFNRVFRKQSSKASKRGLSEEQRAIRTCRNRTVNTADFVQERSDNEHICAALKPLWSAGLILCTDGEKALTAVAKEAGITYCPVNLTTTGHHVVADNFYVHNVNAFHSGLMEWMCCFHGVATHYLGDGLGQRCLIERQDQNISSAECICAAWAIKGIQYAMDTLPFDMLRVIYYVLVVLPNIDVRAIDGGEWVLEPSISKLGI